MSDPAATPAPETTDSAPDFAAFEAKENTLATGGTWTEPAKTTTTAAEVETHDAETTTAEPVTATAETTTTATKAAPINDAGKDYTSPNSRSRRTAKDQEHINEVIRTSVQTATEKLRSELAELKAKQAPAAEPEQKAPVSDPKDPKPVETDFEDYGTFIDARARWNYRQAKREDEAVAAEAAQREQETERERAFETTVSAWVGRRDAFIAKHPERADALTAFLDTVRAGTPTGDAIMDSEVGGELADYLASHPTEVERITRLAPVSALRALGKIEALYETTSASASAGPAAKTVTTAPAPPMTLAARSASPADPSAAALASGDFSAWEAEENRKALAASR